MAVVGAGPAGSTAATALAGKGYSVALIDRATFPRDKACGDGIGPGAVAVAARLGVASIFEGYAPVERLAVSSPSRIEVSSNLPKVGGSTPIGYVIPRAVFDERLFKAAVSRGAIDYSGFSVDSSTFDFVAGTWQIVLGRRGEAKSIEQLAATVLVGADGARSKVRGLMSQRFNSDEHTGIAVRSYATLSERSDRAMRLDFARTLLPAYGWLFPITQDKANIGVGIDVSTYRRRGAHLDTLLLKYLKEIGPRHGLLVEDGSERTAILPYGSQLPRLAISTLHAVLIGDAGSMINPFTGEGIFYGMAAAEMLANSLTSVADRNKLERGLGHFESTFRSRFQSHFDTNWRMKKATSVAGWCDMVISATRRDSKLLGEIVELMMGDRSHLHPLTMLRIFARAFV